MRPVALFASFAAVALLAPHASADETGDKRACVAAHEAAQRARLDGRLRNAHASAIACAREVCPELVRVECTRLLDEVEAALPSVLVEARDGGERISDVALDIDGASEGDHLDGKPIGLDPGEHVVRVTRSDGRSVEEKVVLLEGERRRRLLLELPAREGAPARLAPTASAYTPVAGAHAPSTPVSSPGGAPMAVGGSDARARLPWSFYALGGLGGAGLVTFGAFGLMGFREQAGLEAACAPACAQGSDRAMRRDYLVADVGLAVAVVAAAGATWIALTHR